MILAYEAYEAWQREPVPTPPLDHKTFRVRPGPGSTSSATTPPPATVGVLPMSWMPLWHLTRAGVAPWERHRRCPRPSAFQELQPLESALGRTLTQSPTQPLLQWQEGA